jgi:large subunit ribosomal protein L15
MQLNSLRPATGSTKKRKRIARGTGSGHGGTSTRGHKGDKARSGAKEKRHFEGGQTPMQRRLPKRGFKNINRVEYAVVSLSALEKAAQFFDNTRVDGMPLTLELLAKAGLVAANDKVKVLANGKITSKVAIQVHAISAAAKTAIEAAGGSVELV